MDDRRGAEDGSRVHLPLLTVMANLDLAARLHEIGARTLLVVPGTDTVGAKAGYEILRRIPNAEFIVYEGLSRNIANGVPDRCASDLRRFLLKDRAVSPTPLPGERAG